MRSEEHGSSLLIRPEPFIPPIQAAEEIAGQATRSQGPQGILLFVHTNQERTPSKHEATLLPTSPAVPA
jgi:hypothetical protein